MDKDKLQLLLNTFFGEDLTAELKVEVEEIANSESERPEYQVNLMITPEKVSFLIGRGGRTIKTVRELIGLYARLHNISVRVEIPE